MNLKALKQMFTDNGCNRLYIKKLAPNDNSKNQIYLGGSFEVVNIFPFSKIQADNEGDWKRARFKAQIDFVWLTDSGRPCPAPDTQLILYPKYPEVRLSGFLKNSPDSPSQLLQSRDPGRILILSPGNGGRIFGYAVSSGSAISREIDSLTGLEQTGVFLILPITMETGDTKSQLIEKIKQIHNKNWINSKRLDSRARIVECNSPNCGGYTLEAELNITPNGYSDPDYLGWEVKQFNVPAFNRINGSVITLMTPEPTGGFYKKNGVDSFIRKYGYKDKLGRKDRLNFGGVHYCGAVHQTTGLTLVLSGYDATKKKIRNPAGAIELVDKKDNVAASWAFDSLLTHWNRKHAKAVYIPSMCRTDPIRQYSYGNQIILGEHTDFLLFLQQMNDRHVYYDPGIKMESVSDHPKTKRRSQFRIRSEFLPSLYNNSTLLNLNDC